MSFAVIPRCIVYVLRVFPKISETFIASELAELRRRGIDLRILSLLPPRGDLIHDIVSRAGLDKITCYEPKDFPAVLREFRPQLLHAHFATEATAAAIELATEERLPFTFTAHGYDIHRKPPSDFGARAKAARAVVTVSHANAAYITQTFGVPASHIRVIPCGVDTERFRPAPLAAARVGKGFELSGSQAGPYPRSHSSTVLDYEAEDEPPPLIVCVARHVLVKNLGLLLDACALLAEHGVRFRCILLGDGPCRRELEAARARLGLLEIVEMRGAAEQSQVLAWWQHAAVGVLTSDSEGVPVSLMEAAACGVPAVATSVGGVPELVEDGVTGLLVPPRDAPALASALERLLGDQSLRRRLGEAARQRAQEKFSVTRQVDQLLGLWSEILATGGATPVFVSDSFGAESDSALPTLALALDPVEARNELKRRLPRLSGENGRLRLKAIRVARHKPGRRCVVEYDVRVERSGKPPERVTLIGKVRVRRFGNEGYRLLERFWSAGFDAQSADGISVPEPIGVVPRFQMWFQRKVPGETATRLLGGPEGIELARRIAAAIYKLHQANIPAERRHSMADELRILRECLAKVAALKPDWKNRLERMSAACDRLGADLAEPRPCGIHRDFYPAQVIVNGPRLYLIDFDLYCLGDPGLDIGNFIGHMTEQSLREHGDPRALAAQENALEETFLKLAGDEFRASVRAYTTLTLVRHIYLSTQFADRQKLTEALVQLCEQRLRIA
ncbi:MAG TPA: glycosyltransferase [Candidatus Limnocylindrales bacterium]|nr:glycosyltransferase [Candidatus Limnocylindrales bacterium]